MDGLTECPAQMVAAFEAAFIEPDKTNPTTPLEALAVFYDLRTAGDLDAEALALGDLFLLLTSEQQEAVIDLIEILLKVG